MERAGRSTGDPSNAASHLLRRGDLKSGFGRPMWRAPVVRVAMLIPDAAEALSLAAVLRSGGHEVRAAKDADDLLQLAIAQPPDLVLLSGDIGDPLARAVRAVVEVADGAHVLVAHQGLPDEAIIRLLEAGADGDLRRPTSAGVFFARIAAIQRRVSRTAKVRSAQANVATVVPLGMPAGPSRR